MGRFIILVFSVFIVISGTSQVPHETPMNPKGDPATQKLALPYYNEACELYKNNQVYATKKTLYQAIATDFALIEAHLFLADIYRLEGKLDSALFFYNSGIDFVVEQKPHYYFYLFDLGMRLGEYDLVKHNIRHFNKLYASHVHDTSRFEPEFPFTKDDFEYYEACIGFVYNYDSWVSKGNYFTEHKKLAGENIISSSNGLYSYDGNYLRQLKDNGKKGKKIKGLPVNALNPRVCGSTVIYGLDLNGNVDLYYSRLKGNKLSDAVKFSVEINSSSWEGHPFLNNTGDLLYFSSERNGSKDLFVAKLNPETFEVISITPISRLNTEHDEMFPYWDETKNQFYYSTDRGIGFGGVDIFRTAEYESTNGINLPFSVTNLKAPFNTNHDDIECIFRENGNVLISRIIDGKLRWFEYQPVISNKIDYNIRLNNTLLHE